MRLSGITLAIFVAAGLAACPRAVYAQETPAADASAESDPLDELNAELKDMSIVVVDPTAPPATPAGTPSELDALKSQISALRAEVQTLTDAVHDLRTATVDRLEQENAALREELARLYNLNPGQEPVGTGVPQPENPLVQAAREAAAMKAEAPAEAGGKSGYDPAMWTDLYGDEGYVVVREATRTAEDAASLGENVSTLKDMILLVPPGIDDVTLSDLGRTLREEFDSFDNIRLDFFDDPDAAEAYANQNVDKSGHHVMNVTKHSKSGLDSIVLIKGNTKIAVTR